MFRVYGYSMTSERYDQDSRNVDYELDTGEAGMLQSASYYQKYGGRSSQEEGSLGSLCAHLKDRVGLKKITEKQVLAFATALQNSYGG